MRLPSKLKKPRFDAAVPSSKTSRGRGGPKAALEPPSPSPTCDGSRKTRTPASSRDDPPGSRAGTHAKVPRLLRRVTRGALKPVKPPARSTRNVAPTYVPKKRREELAPTPHADEPRNTRKPPRKNKLLERTPRGALAAAAAAAAAHRRGRPRMDRDAVVSDAVRREPRTPQGRAARRDRVQQPHITTPTETPPPPFHACATP